MLKIEGLKKEYKNFTLDCTLSVKIGMITGLVGQNGAGKSTAFKAALGLISSDGGDVTLFGKNVKELTASDRENIGVVLSDSGFSGYLTVKDIIPILKALYKKFDPDFFNDRINRFGLPLDKQIKDFSSGMKAKLKVIAAISHSAKLLILDEPTAGLDVIARDELLFMLREYMEQDGDRAVLISSHISSDLETLCDDIYMIDGGRVILHEDTDVLLSDYAVIKVDEDKLGTLDRQYIRYIKKEPYGYACLTDEKQYYLENHPDAVIEKAGIDGIITIMIKGEKQ